MNVLIACEFSGIVRDAFRLKGHEAWSCDILDIEDLPRDLWKDQKFPNYHFHGDCLDFIKSFHWDLMIAHPPCTYLTNSGVRWLHSNPDRWELMRKGAYFFKNLLDAPIERKCIENPIMHKYALAIINQKYSQIIHPWQFGHGESKATCLWLENLPLLKPTNIVDGRNGKVWRTPPGNWRWAYRSLTYRGIADAMADQWG